jgi:hypothetical protein
MNEQEKHFLHYSEKKVLTPSSSLSYKAEEDPLISSYSHRGDHPKRL